MSNCFGYNSGKPWCAYATAASIKEAENNNVRQGDS